MTSKMVMILAGILERLQYSFPEENPEVEQTAKINNVLHPFREGLKQFIEKADANPYLANVLGEKYGEKIIGLAHSFEDSMELYMLGFKSRKNRSSNSNDINFRVNEMQLRDAGRKFCRACNFSIDSILNLASENGSVSDGQHRSFGIDMVGMEDAVKDLASALRNGTKHLKLVSICGMPGIGKTTLALKIYEEIENLEEEEMENHLFVRAWVSVSQHTNRRDILLEIHHFVVSYAESDNSLLGYDGFADHGIDSVSDDVLAERIRKYLKKTRYLVVLDDVPDANVWFCLRNCFPDNEFGSRILITTQLKDSAIQVGGPETYIHTMRLLTDEESLKLLREELNEKDVEKFGNDIKNASGGLPLAIHWLAFSVKENPSKQWEWHLENLYGGSQNSSLFNVLDSSYRKLPIQLRACLLYLANYFQELSEIEMDTVCQLLIAEGLVLVEDNKNNGKTMMDVAAHYLDELDNRFLIQITDEEIDEQNEGIRRFKSFRIDNVIGGFCKSKKNNHGFVDAIDLKDENQCSISSTRVGIFLDEVERSYDFLSKNLEIIRSLLVFNSTPSERGYLTARELPSLEKFNRLRVLYLYAVDFKKGKLPQGMENLVHLRYLSFRDCYLLELSSSISNLYYLQTLDLRVRIEDEIVSIPCHALNGLESLRYLYLPPSYQTTPPGDKLRLQSAQKLELLDNYDASFGCVGDLLTMPNLMWVTVTTMGHDVDLEIETILSFISKNSGILRWMSLDLRDYDCYSKERLDRLNGIFNSTSLHTLHIHGYIKELPTIQTPSNITKIVLNGSELKKDPMRMLGHLPNLKILLLETEAYNGTQMKCSSGHFPKLRYLKLSKLYNLSKWDVDQDQAMPRLTTLIIEGCESLSMLPKGMPSLTNLKKLEIMSMPDRFVLRIQKRNRTPGEDFNLIEHVPNIKVNGQSLIFSTEDTKGKSLKTKS